MRLFIVFCYNHVLMSEILTDALHYPSQTLQEADVH